MDTATWAPLLQAPTDGHVAIVYRDQAFLAEAVAQWSLPALRAGGAAILVGTAAHAVSIRERLRKAGTDVADAERTGRLVFIDADWLMGHFILDGTPDADKFRLLCDEIVGGVRARCAAGTQVRAWGEMVSLLRLRGDPAAAMRLEELWAGVVKEKKIALLCSYDAAHGSSGEGHALMQIAASHGEIILQPETELAETARSRA